MSGEHQLRLTLLGGFALAIDDETVPSTAWRLSKARDVVKALALAPGRRLQRDQVLELLWPDKDPTAATNNLHQVLYAARRAIRSAGGDGHQCLRLAGETLALCPDDAVWVDAEVFERTARKALDADDYDRCRAALDVYAGDLLPDDRYADWVQPHREALWLLHQEVTARLAGHLENRSDLAGAAELLRRLLVDDPLNEPVHRQLMRVYARAGHRGAAAEQYDRLADALRGELGVLPDDATQALADEVAAGEWAPLEEAAVTVPTAPPTNLAAPLSTFVGRAQELAELPSVVDRSRLVTLVGAGGCGKTRLAVEVGRLCLDHAPARWTGGVFLVELAAVDDADDVALETARTLETRPGPDETPAGAVARRIGDRPTLLLLDNCEHQVQATAALAAEVLAACPALTILATSREPLRVPGELVRRVSSLRAPNPARPPPVDELADYDAVQLFAERVRAVQPRFAVDEDVANAVAEVCFRLDGMPLALELAATRVPALSVAGVAEHLDDRFRLLTTGPRTALTRQQTLGATVEWSYRLLAPEEQALFRRLSVFHGRFDLAAARAVAPPGREDVAPLLGELVERSMVVADDADHRSRYHLLETMRAFGLARLGDAGEVAEVRRDHAGHVLNLADPRGAIADLPGRMAALAAVHDDLRPALEHLLGTRPGTAVRLAADLWPYWLWHAHIGEGLGMVERVIDHAPGPSADRAEALVGAAALAVRWHGFEAMARYADRSLVEARALGDGAATCRALLFSTLGPWCRDDFAGAQQLMTEARRVARDANLAAAELGAIKVQAMAATARRRYEDAAHLLEEAESLLPRIDEDDLVLDLYSIGSWMPTRRDGHRRLMWSETWVVIEDLAGWSVHANLLAARAKVAQVTGDAYRAEALLERALEGCRSDGDEPGEARVRCRMGQLAFDIGELKQAENELRASLDLRDRIGHVRGAEVCLIGLARVARERGQPHLAREHLYRAETLARERLDRVVRGPLLIERGLLALDDGDPEAAVDVLSEALTIGRAAGYSLHAACVLRDLGGAQLAAGQDRDAATSLAEAAATFRAHGHHEEAEHCDGLLTSD